MKDPKKIEEGKRLAEYNCRKREENSQLAKSQSEPKLTYYGIGAIVAIRALQSVSWILSEFYFNRGLQRLYTGTYIILQKTINRFLCLLIVFLKSKTYQLILKDVIKLNRNLR